MQEKFCFGRVSVSVFVRFAFTRLGSAPLGSGRLGAREGSSRDYMYKKIRHGRVLKWLPYTVAESLKLAGTTYPQTEIGRARPIFHCLASKISHVRCTERYCLDVAIDPTCINRET